MLTASLDNITSPKTYIVARSRDTGERYLVHDIADCSNAKFMLGNYKRRYGRKTGLYFRIESTDRHFDVEELPSFFDTFDEKEEIPANERPKPSALRGVIVKLCLAIWEGVKILAGVAKWSAIAAVGCVAGFFIILGGLISLCEALTGRD